MWIVPWTVAGSLPMFSIVSISPQAGHDTWPMFAPSIQNADQTPCPAGIFTLAEKRPYCFSNSPWLSKRAEEYWQAPYQQLRPPPPGSCLATTWSRPPATCALAVPSV